MIRSYLVLQGEAREKIFSLAKPVTLGRSPSNAIYLSDPHISKQHASVYMIEGQAVIEDMNSHNGTFVNGKLIHKSNLSTGDVIRIGNTTLRFLQEEGHSGQADDTTMAKVSRTETTQGPDDLATLSVDESQTQVSTDAYSFGPLRDDKPDEISKTGAPLAVDQVRDVQQQEDTGRLLNKLRCHFSSDQDLNERIYSLLEAARTSIYFAVHSLVDAGALRTFLEVKNRGLTVKGIVSFEQLNHDSEVLVDVINAGLGLKLTSPDGPPMYHNFVIIDENLVASGSINLIHPSTRPADRSLMVIEDGSVARMFINEFNRIWDSIVWLYQRKSPSEPLSHKNDRALGDHHSDNSALGQPLPSRHDTEAPDGIKRHLNLLLSQERRAEAVHLINSWLPEVLEIHHKLKDTDGAGEDLVYSDEPITWTNGHSVSTKTDRYGDAEDIQAEQVGGLNEDIRASIDANMDTADYWHTQVGRGLTRREIYMMKKKISSIVKRLSFLCITSLALCLAIMFAIPQMLILSYITFFGFVVAFAALYITLIIFNYRLAKAFRKNAPLWGFLSIFFIPSIFLYSWFMNKS